MVERKSKYLRVRKTTSLKSATTMQAACRGMNDLPENLLHTMTFEGGKEFAQHELLTDKLGLQVYFARPYASWPKRKHQRTASAVFSQRNRLCSDQSPRGGPSGETTQRTPPKKPRLQNPQRSHRQENLSRLEFDSAPSINLVREQEPATGRKWPKWPIFLKKSWGTTSPCRSIKLALSTFRD